MMKNCIKDNRILIIVTLLLIAGVSAAGIFLDSNVWAQPEIIENISEDALIDDTVPAAGDITRQNTKPEKLYLKPAVMIADTGGQSLSQPVADPLPEGEASGYITVGLYSSCSSVSNGPVSEINVSCEDGFYLSKTVGRGYAPDKDLRSYTTLTVKTVDGVVNLYDTDGNVIITGLCNDDVLFSAAEDADSRFISVGSAKYRDGVMFRAESDTRMAVINFINLEHYLWGTLHNEMSAGNPIEALKAQAVACRSFAVSHYGYHGKYGFDLCSTTNCQVYKGVSAEMEQTIRACRDTQGIVMYCGGKIASGYYFASSGGYTMNSEDVWGGSISYLRAVPDAYAPMKVWNTSISFDALAKKLSANGMNVGKIQSVQITDHYPNGAVKTMLITGDAGSASLTGSYNSSRSMVSVIGSGTLQSVFFTMSTNTQSTEQTSVVATTSGQMDASAAVVLNADGTTSTIDLEGACAIDGDTVTPVTPSAIQAPAPAPQPQTVENGIVYFSGSGYGHGCGMPQTSAVAMANAGHSYDEILSYYYTGIQLQQLQ